MCRLKYYTVNHRLGWRLSGVTAIMFLILGAISFGYGIKLMEYAEKKDITPIFAAVPMIICSLCGASVVVTKKLCAVVCYTIMSVIVCMLSIHMNYRFMVKEYSVLPLYRTNCQLAPDDIYFCLQYSGTIILCCVSVAMVPVALGALLGCLVANKTLNKKNCVIIWFSFSKLEPAERIRNNNRPIKLINYRQSTELIGEIPETRPANDYIPDIPDFMELSIPSSNQAYGASVMIQNERADQYKLSTRNIHSKSLSDLDEGSSPEILYENGGKRAASNDELITMDNKSVKKGKKRHSKNTLSTSDLKQRSNDLENLKYYDSAAEDWIHKLVDNHQNSRSRLYGISDEEDLESDNDDSADLSTTKLFLPKQTIGQEVYRFEGLENKEFSASVPLLTTKNKERNDFIDATEKGYNEPEFSGEPRSPSGQKSNSVSPPELIAANSKQAHHLVFSKRKRMNAASSPGDIENDNDSNKQEVEHTTKDFEDTAASDRIVAAIQSETVENFSKDLTPAGLITPMAGHPSPNGQLRFEFDRATSVSDDHPSKNWIVFQENEDRKRLLEGKMTASEYDDLTSYVM